MYRIAYSVCDTLIPQCLLNTAAHGHNLSWSMDGGKQHNCYRAGILKIKYRFVSKNHILAIQGTQCIEKTPYELDAQLNIGVIEYNQVLA